MLRRASSRCWRRASSDADGGQAQMLMMDRRIVCLNKARIRPPNAIYITVARPQAHRRPAPNRRRRCRSRARAGFLGLGALPPRRSSPSMLRRPTPARHRSDDITRAAAIPAGPALATCSQTPRNRDATLHVPQQGSLWPAMTKCFTTAPARTHAAPCLPGHGACQRIACAAALLRNPRPRLTTKSATCTRVPVGDRHCQLSEFSAPI